MTLEQLCSRLALALATDYAGQSSGRVRDVPDARTVRYYTTLGLIDRPAALRGRTALYGRRHLLQLVAIKRLQAQGAALGEIQQRLLNLSNAALARIACLPADAEFDAEPANHEQMRERFWATPDEPCDATSPRRASEALPAAAQPLIGVPLDVGATLLLRAARQLDEYDLTALRVAAAPLLKLLRARRLVGPDMEPAPTKGDAP